MSKEKKYLQLNIIQKRKLWYLISCAIIIAGIVSFAIQGFNFGIDFTGGSYLQLTFTEGEVETATTEDTATAGDAAAEDATDVKSVEVPLEDLRAVVNQYVEKTPTIQHDKTNNAYVIRTELTEEDAVNELLDAIRADVGPFQIDRNELVGPTIGNELVQKAILALVIACVLMLVYISFRFQFWFGISSIITLIHDAFIVLSVFTIFQLEMSSSFIAAILTVIGYSINATIVVFDRVRESQPNYKAADRLALMNDSISMTFARSMNTTITTLLTLFALLIFGGDTTKIFVFAMIVGITAGLYSSICLSGSLYFDLAGKFSKKSKS